MRWQLTAVVVLLGMALGGSGPAWAYVDIQPTLGRIVNEARWVFVVRVEKVSREKRAVIYAHAGDVKGKWAGGRIRHQLTDGDPPRPPRYLLDWAQPGREAVVFVSRSGSLVCTGESWYRTGLPEGAAVEGGGDGGGGGGDAWWRMTLDCPESALAYRGSARRLAGAVREMMAGRTVVITTVAHGAQGRGSFSDVVFNSLQSGGPVAMQRLRAGLFMPGTIYGINERSPWFVGLGVEGAVDLKEVSEGLRATEKWDRVEAVDEVRRMGEAGRALAGKVGELLADPEAVVRAHAAAAVLGLDVGRADARDVLIAELRDESSDVRREAARCLGRLGRAVRFALPALLQSMERAQGDDVRVAIIEAIGSASEAAGASAGPSPRPSPGVPGNGDAAAAKERLIRLLDDGALRTYAAEAIGRIGPGAAEALPKLAAMLGSPDADAQWAGARAMVLIGGEGARPVVPFLIRRLEVAPRGRELYQLTWLLGLLGPVARDALPALGEARNRDNELASMAMWAVAPEEAMPWQLGYDWDRDCDLWLFADYIGRMGERSRGAAVALAEKIVEGRAGRVPSWGYHLLVARADAAVPVLVAVVDDPAAGPKRGRAIAALGRMGAAAGGAVESLKKVAGGPDGALASAARDALQKVARNGRESPPEGRAGDQR